MSETSAVVEKSLRSVFVGNIPYEATEEKLRDIFSQVGPVLSFKLMYDRESGKPKGYGFCEYKDQETALSAMRNLNGFEIGGRPLRVDNACTEKSRMEMQSLMMGPTVESPFGPDVDTDKAPEAISNAVASLPPEQMYELMRQMKLCVRNNPAEARTMLMNNPQLAYALLQAQVVMRIIDPKTAVQILHGSRDHVDPLLPNKGTNGPPPPSSSVPSIPHLNGGTSSGPPNMPPHFPPNTAPPMIPGIGPQGGQGPPPGVPFPPPSQSLQGPPPSNRGGPPFSGGDYDLRQMSGAPRGPAPVPPPSSDQDMRMPPNLGAPPPPSHDNFGSSGHEFEGRFGRGDFDQRDNRYRDGPPPPRDRDPRESRDSRAIRDPRDRDRDYRSAPMDNRDPRGRSFSGAGQDRDFRSRDPPPGPPQGVPPPSRPPPPATVPSNLAGQDQEKASLIMQVLQLSDEQIRMLPPEQRASILQLKEQIQRSSH